MIEAATRRMRGADHHITNRGIFLDELLEVVDEFAERLDSAELALFEWHDLFLGTVLEEEEPSIDTRQKRSGPCQIVGEAVTRECL